MREIKFRGKRKDNNEWVYGYLAQSCYGLMILDSELYHVDGAEWNVGGHIVIPETVGQMIMKYKEKELYVDDIVKLKGSDEYWLIRIDDFGAPVFEANGFNQLKEYKLVEFSEYLFEYSVEDIENVGNFHENPELIKGAEK